MHKLKIKQSCVISLYDEFIEPEFHHADILLLLLEYKDKMGLTRYKEAVTSKIISRALNGDRLEISTYFGNSYLIDSNYDVIDMTMMDFVVHVSDQFMHEDRAQFFTRNSLTKK